MKKPPMISVPAISILHLSHVTRSGYLVSQYGDVADELPFMVATHDNGYFMTVPTCHAQADDEQREEWATIPADLRDVFNYIAPHAAFAWFMLDVDGDIIPGLTVADEDAGDTVDPMAGERCETCACALESGQIGHCEDCAPQFVNSYECPSCGHTWDDEYSCAVDEDCPSCGLRHISPVSSSEVQA